VTQPRVLDDSELVDRLRRGDEHAFATLLDQYYDSMLHVARGYVSSREAAEDVVQETFLGVIQGIASFEGRSSLRTWMFRILVNRAQTRGAREKRAVPFSSMAVGPDEPAVDPDRFAKDGRWAGFWTTPLSAEHLPEADVLTDELGDRLRAALDGLPAAQRAVLEMRDVLGFGSDEVCSLLNISDANQRVLLHRARSKARTMLESYVALPGGGH
jgi:RNA polymerase sigma-70 factor (ECF subfamily)